MSACWGGGLPEASGSASAGCRSPCAAVIRGARQGAGQQRVSGHVGADNGVETADGALHALIRGGSKQRPHLTRSVLEFGNLRRHIDPVVIGDFTNLHRRNSVGRERKQN